MAAKRKPIPKIYVRARVKDRVSLCVLVGQHSVCAETKRVRKSFGYTRNKKIHLPAVLSFGLMTVFGIFAWHEASVGNSLFNIESSIVTTREKRARIS